MVVIGIRLEIVINNQGKIERIKDMISRSLTLCIVFLYLQRQKKTNANYVIMVI